MIIEDLRRPLSRLALLAVLLTVGFGPSVVAAEADCRVQLTRGWAQGNGTGKIVMKKDGKLCGSTLHSVPDFGIPVDTIQVLSEPKNGKVSLDAPRFFYTPNSGFTGKDRFELAAEGPSREGRVRIKLKGEVTVQVDP
jgi:hypothetical protein